MDISAALANTATKPGTDATCDTSRVNAIYRADGDHGLLAKTDILPHTETIVKYGNVQVTKDVFNTDPHPGYEKDTTLLHVAVNSGKKVKIDELKSKMLEMFDDLQFPPQTSRADLLQMLRAMQPEAKEFYVKRHMNADLVLITNRSGVSFKLQASDMILWE
jgi:hypothetical protein